jgi:hypothetical protein
MATVVDAPVVMQLTWEHKDGNIVVTPSNQDRFLIKIGRAIEILRQHQRQQQFEKQFDLLLKELASWLEKHEGRWSRAFLTAGESTLRFIVVRGQVKFESDLTDALSDLGVEVANDPDLELIQLSTRALPLVTEEALQSFLDASFTIEFHGDRARTHSVSQSKP